MKLILQNVHLPLAHFPLVLNVELEGEIIAVLGPSGAGKTSLLDLVAGLRKPTSARIQFDSTLLNDTAQGIFVPPSQRGIGYVPQDGALFPHLSVRANLRYGAKRLTGSPLFSVEHVSEVLEIRHTLNGSVHTLSGGEQQRVALARALLSQPRLLLLDEPLASLDDTLKRKTLALLKRLREEFRIPMLYVSHSAEETTALCDSVLILNRGQVEHHGAISPREPGLLSSIPE